MKERLKLRQKLTYSNVVSTLCLFLLLGGGAAYAAAHLGKNSVGAKQLKKNAVTTAKIKKGAVTAAKVKNGSLTGAQINLSTLGTVPRAQTADTAGTAGTAGSLGPAEPWHEVGAPGEPQFLNGWTNEPPFGSVSLENVGFYKDQMGIVHLKGKTEKGSEVIFNLPPGFRPAAHKFLDFPAQCGNCAQELGFVAINGSGMSSPGDDGAVIAPSGANVTGLDGISFRAES
jgi:hypothetical protein